MNSKSPMEIASFVAVVGIPWSFKILIAPFMDRFTILSMGRKRPWVIFGQLGLIISFLCIGLINDPLNNLNHLMIAGFCISFFGAFQSFSSWFGRDLTFVRWQNLSLNLCLHIFLQFEV